MVFLGSDRERKRENEGGKREEGEEGREQVEKGSGRRGVIAMSV